MPLFILLSSLQGHCKSSLGSFDECRLSTKWRLTLRPSQQTWAVSLPVGGHHLRPPSPFTVLLSLKADTHPTEGRRLSRPKDGWLQTETVSPLEDGHPSKY